MNLLPAGLLVAGLLASVGRAEPVRLRDDGVRIGSEVLAPALDEVAARGSTGAWEVKPAGLNALLGAFPEAGGFLLTPGHPVLHVAGMERSDLTRRIVTGRVSVLLQLETEDPADAAAMADEVARAHGLVDDGVAEGAAPWRLFRADRPERVLTTIDALRSDARVAEAEVVVARQLARRGLPNDPLLPYQWNLKNLVPAADGGSPVDLGLEGVWADFSDPAAGRRGRGVRIGIMDDGIDSKHPEFGDGKLDVAAGRNWNGGNAGNAGAQGPSDTHGTAVAGLAAAAAENGQGVAGVAPAAGLVSLRLTAGPHDDADEAQAIAHLANARTGLNPLEMIHVKNASWGPPDGVFRPAGPGPLARQALTTAARDGRGGRGTVFVWSAGNGGGLGEDANADGYANSPYVIAVGSIDSNGRVPDYSEGGACVAVVAPSEAAGAMPVVTTDRPGRAGFNPPSTGVDVADVAYTSGFGGTSAAAPQVAGVCALMLEANPSLSWRDVKEILIRSARRVNPDAKAWMANAAGLRFHPRQGAGLMDAATATAMAASWKPLGPSLELESRVMQPEAIPDNSEAGITRAFKIDSEQRVEHALLRLTASHQYRGDLKVTLTSPGGTTSVLAPSYFAATPTGQGNYEQWVFSSIHFWGENSQGTWTLRVADVLSEESGRFSRAELSLLTSEWLPDPLPGLYDTWITSQGVPSRLAGPADDADQDGWSNLLEYACGGRPLTPDSLEPSRCLASPSLAPAIVFRRWPARSDVDWQVEHSMDAVAWTAIARSEGGQPAKSTAARSVDVAETAQPDGSVLVTVTDTIAPAPENGWFRLRAVLQR